MKQMPRRSCQLSRDVVKTTQQDLKSKNLSLDEAVDMAQNSSLWILISAFCALSSACHKWRKIQNLRICKYCFFCLVLRFTASQKKNCASGIMRFNMWLADYFHVTELFVVSISWSLTWHCSVFLYWCEWGKCNRLCWSLNVFPVGVYQIVVLDYSAEYE